jgi:hypothetical protein
MMLQVMIFKILMLKIIMILMKLKFKEDLNSLLFSKLTLKMETITYYLTKNSLNLNIMEMLLLLMQFVLKDPMVLKDVFSKVV